MKDDFGGNNVPVKLDPYDINHECFLKLQDQRMSVRSTNICLETDEVVDLECYARNLDDLIFYLRCVAADAGQTRNAVVQSTLSINDDILGYLEDFDSSPEVAQRPEFGQSSSTAISVADNDSQANEVLDTSTEIDRRAAKRKMALLSDGQ